MPIEFELSEPARILVGIFEGDSPAWAKAPGVAGWELFLSDALTINGLSGKINVYACDYPAGRQKLDLGKGTFLVFGFTKPAAKATRRTAASARGSQTDLIRLFD